MADHHPTRAERHMATQLVREYGNLALAYPTPRRCYASHPLVRACGWFVAAYVFAKGVYLRKP